MEKPCRVQNRVMSEEDQVVQSGQGKSQKDSTMLQSNDRSSGGW